MDVVLSPALKIDAIGQQLVVRADLHPDDVAVGFAFGQFVDVDHNLLVRIRCQRLATIDRVLLAFFVTGVVNETVPGVGNRLVVLLDAGHRLIEQFLLQWFDVSHLRLGVFVFQIQVTDHVRVFALPQPIEFVITSVTVHRHLVWHFGRLGGFGVLGVDVFNDVHKCSDEQNEEKFLEGDLRQVHFELLRVLFAMPKSTLAFIGFQFYQQ